ncbi:hypothetical protein DCAR_0209696 [Daucus carota subsp. sativus]|uniref:DC1 domain-containing protein n=1 Tax=Daucus carota subsp. sativus TaxID=79200 RepID=A0AAF1ARQ3_DAUCS|nr:PREDICTED: uncharacterized protein LOC108209495 [Daucus carota subsp. sativus]WOG90452.1 hypothetical protein DCAR_0209696 [Daucus carota subsp. sativus]
MSSAFHHFSHRKHSLVLNENVTQNGAKCYICMGPVINSPTYTCPTHQDAACQNFYLHKTCAHLPTRINHHKHRQHRVTLVPRPDTCSCDICSRPVKIAYTCDECDFDVCVACTSDERTLHHQGHEHELILMNRKAKVECDACGLVARDSTYVCTKCEFWIHNKCAFADSIVPSPHHHHPLHLVYSIPNFRLRHDKRYCKVCNKEVYNSHWTYYCHRCTYFVHMNCATSTESAADETESEVDPEDLIEKLEERVDQISEVSESAQSTFDILADLILS